MAGWEEIHGRRQRVKEYVLDGWTVRRMMNAENVSSFTIESDLRALNIRLQDRLSQRPKPKELEAYSLRQINTTYKEISKIMNIAPETARRYAAICEQKLINQGEIRR